MRLHLIVLVMSVTASLAHAGFTGVSNSTLAVIVNDNDPQSVKVAKYYQAARQIPAENIIHTTFDHRKVALSAQEFNEIRDQVQRQLPEGVQAYALTWTRPYRVECMSITSAFALGFDRVYCASGCKPTKSVPYYNSQSNQPYGDFGIRPTMMLAGKNQSEAMKLIDRGVQADFSRPVGRAYLVSTSDRNRNVRSATYPYIARTMKLVVDSEIVEADFIEKKTDVLFYFTGVKAVEKLSSNRFLPGALADHLTSAGGILFGGDQMSVLEWLEAGATGSYGTVVEPCNFPGKFPNPAIVIQNYLGGDTLVEAYWKSVAMPGQGLFIGEPLASPYKGCRIRMNRVGLFKFKRMEVSNYVLRGNANC
jgi:uncharacterized protein (TIGR03790 family)